jgi:hypothetical protein
VSNPDLYAEDLPYWQTETTPASNQDRIERTLDKFGAEASMFTMARKGDSAVWMIRFQFRNRTYRFEYQPATPRNKTTRRGESNADQAVRQMAARAYHEIKAILTAAAFDMDDTPRALFGYLELPGESNSGIPPRTSDLDITELTGSLGLPALTQGDYQ